jgi:microcystin-dependent protein
MAQPYVGEIRIFAGNFAPAGWFFCEGQSIPISEFDTLFTLIGTTYGGDGEETFNLPDLRGRIPIHQGNGFILAENGGAEEITLTQTQTPVHNHAFLADTGAGNTQSPGPGVLVAAGVNLDLYREFPPSVAMSPLSISPVGGSQPHTNFQPYQCLNFIISPYGIFPSPT